MNIHGHGDLDFLTPAPTETDRAIAGVARHAIAQQCYYLNTRDSLARKRYEQDERDFHRHNPNLDGRS